MSVSTSQRYLDHALTQIEQQILDSGYRPASALAVDDLSLTSPAVIAASDTGVPVPPEDQTPFIPRPRLAAFFDEMLASLRFEGVGVISGLLLANLGRLHRALGLDYPQRLTVVGAADQRQD